MHSWATDRVGDTVADLERRHHQQAAIASLSQLAIGARDVETLLPNAAALLASTLDVEVVAIGELAADGRRFAVRGGVGIMERGPVEWVETSATAIAALHRQSPLVAGEPGNIEHLGLLGDITGARIASYVAAIVDGEPRAWGVIVVATASARAFKGDEIEFVQSVATVLQLLAEQRRRDRLAVAELEGRFSRIFQASPVALGMSTIDGGRIIDVNARWLTLFGFQRDEVVGRTNAELRLAVEPERRSGLASQARTAGIVPDTEMKVRNKSGEILEIVASAVRLESPDEDLWISAVVDITGRKRAEAAHEALLAREQLARAEAEQALEKLDAVYTITDRMETDHGLGELLGEVLRRLRRTLQVDHASLLLLEEEGTALYLRAIEGHRRTPDLPKVRVPLGVGLSGRIAAENRAMIVNDYATIDLTGIQGLTAEFVRETTQSVMGAPFHVGGKVAGVVVVTCLKARQFSAEDLRLLTLAADRVAPAIERGRLIAKIRTGLERQRALSRRLLTAQEEERRRLAVELHDELGQVLTAVKINLESLQLASGATAAPLVMDGMIQSVDEALQRVRDIALDLRPSVLDDLGLPAAMRWYADRFARAGRLEAHLSIGVLPPLEPGLKTACFRVAQEALTNVDRHARADHVWIDLHVLDGALELSVRDDGTGFDVAAARDRAIHGASVGLLGMQERVALMGGEYEIVRVPAGGTEVRARFPLTTGGPS
jgi:PAS domain S-box-containing protein